MKRNRIMQILAAVLIMLSLSVFTGCDKNLKARLNLLSYLERQKGGSEELSQEKIEELKKSIQACREELDRTLKLGKDLGNYYRPIPAFSITGVSAPARCPGGRPPRRRGRSTCFWRKNTTGRP